jgi:hypothetical protein
MASALDALYAGETVGAIVLVSLVLGGGAALLAGRAIAATWRPPGAVVAAVLLIAAGARFIHFALFNGRLLSVTSYAADTCLFLIVGLIAWRATRTAQMVRQYPWLYARTSPLTWRKIGREN